MKPATVEAMAFRGESAAEMLDISMISPWTNNPRRTIDPERLRELADSIGKVGVLQPILVRPDNARFLIVSGERRWRAARLAGLKQIPAVVRTLTDAEALELAVTENLQREDVPPLEEAEGYERLHTTHGYTVEEIADKVGKSKTYVYSRLKLTSLCEEAREYLRDGRITPTVALLIARIPTPSQQVEATARVAADHTGSPMSATLEAMRAIERHGGAAILDRAFSGFAALPAPGPTTARSWREVLGFTEGRTITFDDARIAYRRLASENHPDRGGDPDRMAEINRAWQQAQEALG